MDQENPPHDCTIIQDFNYNLTDLRNVVGVHQPQIRRFFIVRHKGEEFNRTYYVTTGTSNDNDIFAGTVLGCIGVSKEYMNIRPIKAIKQPATQEEMDALKIEIKKTRKVVEPGTIVKINDIYDNACAMWQRDLFFRLLKIPSNLIVVSEPILSCKDLSNLHTFIKNFPSWECLQLSASIGGGWWETREEFRSFVLNKRYEARQHGSEFISRDPPFMTAPIDNTAQGEDQLHPPLLTGDGKEIIPEMLDEVIPSSKAPPPLKQYLLVLSIIGNVKTLAGLSSTYSSQQKEGEQNINKENLINEIVSLCPEKIANPVRITLNGLKNNEGLFKFFHHLLLNMSKGGRPKTRKPKRTKKRRTKRRTRNPRKSRKSRKRKL